MQKLKSLEMLRAIAAMLVVLFHTQSIFAMRDGIVPFSGLFSSGFRGVDLFFVLSGFIIAHVHARDLGRPQRFANYIFNRAARIYPAVWIMTLFAGCLYAAGFGGADKASKLTAWGITASVLLLPQAGDALVNVTWTLKYEAFFYLIFAVAILNLRIGLALLAAWQCAVLIAGIAFSHEALGPSGFYLRSLCLEFSIGLGCAWLTSRATRLRPATYWASLTTGIAAFVCGMALDSYTAFAGFSCALGAGAIIIGLVGLERSGRIGVPDRLARLGGASYAIYLVHFSAITLLAVLLGHVRFIHMNNAVFLAAAAFGVAAGIAFHEIVDQPIQRLLRVTVKPMLLGRKAIATIPALPDHV